VNRLLDRRALLAAGAAGVAAFLAPPMARALEARPSFAGDPFALGVASGDPSADGVVLWTRLCPDPWDPDGLGDRAYEVGWKLALDPGFKRVARSGTRLALPERAHCVHVDLSGLEPDRDYWYRFEIAGLASPVGRAVTLPLPGASKDRLKLAWVSCQNFEEGWFSAYRDLVAGDPRLILHVGDYVYEHSPTGVQLRRHPVSDPRTLADYRALHAVYKTDKDLQAAHRHTSWVFTWDDHEVANDYAGLNPENPAEASSFPARRAAAYQAYLEHLPISRRALAAETGDIRLYQRLPFGDLADLYMLDTRQYRAARACVDPVNWRSRGVGCPEWQAPGRTVLGAEQERWLYGSMPRSPATWTTLVQTTLFSRLDQRAADGSPVGFQDSWDGYPAARKALTDRLVQARVRNPVFLGGDVHSYWAADVKADFAKPESAVVASEFCGTSVTSMSYGYETYKKIIADGINGHIRFYDDRQRGYCRADIRPGSFQVDYRAIDSIWTQTPSFSTLQAFTVEAGKPGVQLS
jgi:alkaline phosphatase D